MAPDQLFPLRVSDHAVVRYLERRYGLDIEALRKEMVPDQARRHIELFGSGTFPVDEGLRLRAIRGRVVTVLPKRQRKKRGRRK